VGKSIILVLQINLAHCVPHIIAIGQRLQKPQSNEKEWSFFGPECT